MTVTPSPHPRRAQALIWGIGLLVTLVMLALGLWQMSVFRSQGHRALLARMELPPVPIASVVTIDEIPKDAYGRPLQASGTYETGRDLLVPESKDPRRCRVVSPLRLDTGVVLPVVRGVSPTCTAPPPPQGTRAEIGIFLPSEGEPETELPTGRLGTVRLPRMVQDWPGDMTPGFLNLDAEHAGAHGLEHAAVRLPSGQGEARNSGYALQWWVFAAAAMAATVKLSRDAAQQKGLMEPKSRPVDTPVDE